MTVTVYAVERGEYSDYSVDHIFTTRALAEDACDKLNVGSSCECEVVERLLLDEPLVVSEVHWVQDYRGSEIRDLTVADHYRTVGEREGDLPPSTMATNNPGNPITAYGRTAREAKANYDRLARERAEAAGIA
jgi:hypothetical protein